jgi:hypothetical protein
MPIPFDSCPAPIGDREWGANWEEALQDCVWPQMHAGAGELGQCSAFAVDKTGVMVVARASSR